MLCIKMNNIGAHCLDEGHHRAMPSYNVLLSVCFSLANNYVFIAHITISLLHQNLQWLYH